MNNVCLLECAGHGGTHLQSQQLWSSLSLRVSVVTKWAQGQPGLNSEFHSQQNQTPQKSFHRPSHGQHRCKNTRGKLHFKNKGILYEKKFLQCWDVNSGPTPWATLPVSFYCVFFFKIRSFEWFAQGWLPALILLIFAPEWIGLQVWATGTQPLWII
jgi:hypothetical protein